MLRMGMANERSFVGRAVFGFFEKSFQTSGGSGDKERFNFTGHSPA
jgi:hypothetical protein